MPLRRYALGGEEEKEEGKITFEEGGKGRRKGGKTNAIARLIQRTLLKAFSSSGGTRGDVMIST